MKKFRRGRQKKSDGSGDSDDSDGFVPGPVGDPPTQEEVARLDTEHRESSGVKLLADRARKRYYDKPRDANFPTPDEDEDFGVYTALNKALSGVREAFDAMRSMRGTLGWATSNALSEFQKATIAHLQQGNFEEAEEHANLAWHSFRFLRENEHLLASSGRTTFSNNQAKEVAELEYTRIFWPVIIGEEEGPVEFPTAEELFQEGIHPQANLAGLLEAFSETSKMVLEETSNPEMDPEERLANQRRWIPMASSALLVLENLGRGVPGAIIDNPFGRGGYKSALRWIGKCYRANLEHYETLLTQKQLMEGFLHRIGASNS